MDRGPRTHLRRVHGRPPRHVRVTKCDWFGHFVERSITIVEGAVLVHAAGTLSAAAKVGLIAEIKMVSKKEKNVIT